MFGRLNLAARIAGGFGVVLALCGVVGGLSYFRMGAATRQLDDIQNLYLAQMEVCDEIAAHVRKAMLSARTYGLSRQEEYYKQALADSAEIEERLTAARELAAANPRLEQLRADLPQVEADFAKFHKLIEETHERVTALHALRARLEAAEEQFNRHVAALEGTQHKALLRDAELEVGAEKLQERGHTLERVAHAREFSSQAWIELLKAQERSEPALVRAAQQRMAATEQQFAELAPLLRSPEDQATLRAAAEQLKICAQASTELAEQLDHCGRVNRDRAAAGAVLVEHAAAAAEHATTLTNESSARTAAALHKDLWIIGICVVTAIIMGVLLAWGITRSIARPVNRIIAGLTEGADQVTEAAAQVASASQTLAAGASEQASALEETSASLEQMGAMTRTNAENARSANELAGQARQNAGQGEERMQQVNTAMQAINASAGEISKIIKVIEEIAFQTNLLALNAAVEAARAGEHGKGFAVVAEEVRNLAQRSAQAARDTNNLIAQAVARAREGTGVAASASEALGSIVSDIGRIANLLGGITQASSEQAQGVEQINTAVGQMDKVTQSNAAGAEEAASAAEELAAQAQIVRGIVHELTLIVRGGAAGFADRAPQRSAAGRTAPQPAAASRNGAHPSVAGRTSTYTAATARTATFSGASHTRSGATYAPAAPSAGRTSSETASVSEFPADF